MGMMSVCVIISADIIQGQTLIPGIFGWERPLPNGLGERISSYRKCIVFWKPQVRKDRWFPTSDTKGKQVRGQPSLKQRAQTIAQ